MPYLERLSPKAWTTAKLLHDETYGRVIAMSELRKRGTYNYWFAVDRDGLAVRFAYTVNNKVQESYKANTASRTLGRWVVTKSEWTAGGMEGWYESTPVRTEPLTPIDTPKFPDGTLVTDDDTQLIYKYVQGKLVLVDSTPPRTNHSPE